MKRIIALVLSLALVVGLGFGIQVKPAKADNTVDSWYIIVTPKMKSIRLDWEKCNHCKKIVIYRADITKKYKKYGESFKLSKKKFKKIYTLSGKSTSFLNTTVKKKRCYAYYADFYLKVDGKYVKEFTSYSSFKDWGYVGFEKPVVVESSNDNYATSEKQIFFRADYGKGVKPKKFFIYRKGPNDKKYKKIKLKATSNSDDYDFLYCDTNVEANKYYKYKVRGYLKKGKKKYYTKYSKVVKLQAKSKPYEE